MNPSIQQAGSPNYGERSVTFAPHQQWVFVPSDLSFIDETNEVVSQYEGYSVDGSPSGQADATLISASRSSEECEQQLQNVPSYMSRPTPWSFRSPVQDQAISVDSPNSARIQPSSRNWLLSQESRLHNPEHAYLLHHFSTTLCAWLDVCDIERCFGSDAVTLALTSPLLLNSCLAVAARHLSRVAKYDPELADTYHETAVQLLLTMLNDNDIDRHIGIILPSTVILRLFEQLSSNVPVNDLQRHLLGGSVFINSRTEYALCGGLTQAAFWAFVLQDVQFSLAYQIPLRIHTQLFGVCFQQLWQTEESCTDQMIIYRAIWILVETLQYCFGNGSGDYDENSLQENIARWEILASQRLQPFYHGRNNPDAFPTLFYARSGHAIAVQHVCMAKILLLDHRASRLRMGIGSKTRLRDLKNSISQYADVLFGSALSSEDAMPKLFACHAVCTMASWVSNSSMQQQILGLLQTTERHHGWPWRYIVDRLAEDWEVEVPPPSEPP
ncbi:hypothetical protein, variant [Exophiala sideris]|nr:hypothetical protein, variant [Exophiala sideris]